MKTKQLDPVNWWRYLREEIGVDREVVKSYELLIEFITQPLELWMFTPCKLVNGEWVVLEKPSKPLSPDKDEEWDKWTILRNKYEEAKDKVLFERYDLELSLSSHDIIISTTQSRIVFIKKTNSFVFNFNPIKTIQDILHLDLELTERAKEQL